jgi:CRISPR-associated exonuclease Cas4
MQPSVRVNEISLYLRCPRLIFFENLRNKGLPRKIDAKHMLLRSLMLSISEKDDLESHLIENLSRLREELPLVYEIEPDELQLACQELEGEVAGIARALASNLDLLLPCQAEIDLFSDKLGLSGRLDRLASGGMPSLIRTGKAPLFSSPGRDLQDAHQSRTCGVFAPGPGANG